MLRGFFDQGYLEHQGGCVGLGRKRDVRILPTASVTVMAILTLTKGSCSFVPQWSPTLAAIAGSFYRSTTVDSKVYSSHFRTSMIFARHFVADSDLELH